MEQRTARPRWLASAVAAVAVSGLVLGVWLATDESSRSGAGTVQSVTATATSTNLAAGPATAIALFPADEVGSVDTTREVVVDLSVAWPLGSCAPMAADRGRVDFVSGAERGPEYVRELAVGWYVDEAAAELSYDAVWAHLQGCATNGVTLESAPLSLGTAGLVATLAQPAVDGDVYVSIYALTRLGGVVTLAVDHTTFHDDTVPAPTDATTTLEHAERLVAEVCRVEPSRC